MPHETRSESLLASFADVPDPRTRACRYPWDELMFTALCGVCSGAADWVGVVDWATLKLDWLRQYLVFDNGVASHDTFSRVFSLLDAQRFETCFVGWTKALCPNLAQQLIPIDGKSVRRSHNGQSRMAHLVSAWHTKQGLVLAQVKTAAKSNEITAIPELLDALDVQGAIITIDAMGCQRAVVEKIVARQADYIIGVKDNQPSLAQAIEKLFDANDATSSARPLEQHTSVDKGAWPRGEQKLHSGQRSAIPGRARLAMGGTAQCDPRSQHPRGGQRQRQGGAQRRMALLHQQPRTQRRRIQYRHPRPQGH